MYIHNYVNMHNVQLAILLCLSTYFPGHLRMLFLTLSACARVNGVGGLILVPQEILSPGQFFLGIIVPAQEKLPHLPHHAAAGIISFKTRKNSL